jgi:hypothetical protein
MMLADVKNLVILKLILKQFSSILFLLWNGFDRRLVSLGSKIIYTTNKDER